MNKYLDAYYRVSTRGQKTEGHSLESQRKISEQLADRLGLILRSHDEGAKSSTLKNTKGQNVRDELDEIKSGIEDGEVRNIWIVETSRLFRTRLEHITFESLYLEKYGCQMWVGDSSEPWKFGKKEEVNLLYAFQQIMDENESRKIRRRSIRGKRHLLENHSDDVPIFLGGTPTFGYRNENKRWVIDKEESKWVKWMFREYADGMQTIEIKNQLDSNGIPPRRTRTGLWNVGTIQKMLGNESYTGLKRWFDKDSEKEYVYQIPQIISVSLYRKVKKRLQQNQRISDNNKKHFGLLDGLLECCCGLRMSSTSKKRPSGKTTETYFCVSKSRKWRGEDLDDCNNQKSCERSLTDKAVVKLVKSVVKDSVSLKEQFKSEVLATKIADDEEIKIQKKSLEDKVRRNHKSLENTVHNIAKIEIERIQGRKDPKVVDLILKGLEDEKEHYEREYQRFVQEIEDLDERKQWLDWLSQYGDFINRKTSTPKKTREWLEGLITKVIVSPEFEEDRDGKQIQYGHNITVQFKMKIVGDKLEYKDTSEKSSGYEIKTGRNKKKSGVLDISAPVGKPKKKQVNSGADSNCPIRSNQLLWSSSDWTITRANEYSNFLFFEVSKRFNYLQPEQNPTRYSENQFQIYRLINSLHQRGIGYRRIAYFLNDRKITTHGGSKWGTQYVYSVLKRYREREERIKLRNKKYPLQRGQMWIEFTK